MTTDEPRYRPWLSIPAADYEAHMGPDGAGQLAVLSGALAEAYGRTRPRRLLVLGCATGNGLEHVRCDVTERVVGVDVNPSYLAVTRERFGASLPGLELVCADVERLELEQGSFDLIFAGLIFEYVEAELLLERIARWLGPEGVCCAVLQLAGDGSVPVSDTGVSSLRSLAPVMRLLTADELARSGRRAGLRVADSREARLPADKRLLIARLERDA